MKNGYFIGLGSNLDPARSVARALERLLALFGPLEVSRIIRTDPVGRLKGPFLNLVLYLESELDAAALKERLCHMETEFGRDRSDANRGQKDRYLDLDILLAVADDHGAITAEQIPAECYYRASMLELVHAMGFSCPLPAEPAWNAAEISLAGTPVGLKPMRLTGGAREPEVHLRRAALVTGAALRVGNAIAMTLARRGFDIALHYNTSRDAAERAAEQVRAYGVRCELFQLDLAETDRIPALVEAVAGRFPQLDVLVNSASVYDMASIAQTTPEMLDRQWSINFKAPFFLIREFARRIEHGGIINLLDNKIAFNQYQYAAYLGAKKALAELTKMAALEFSPRLRVNGVAPGVILPPVEREQAYLEWRKEAIPSKILGDPEQVCAAVVSLLDNSFINGQVMFVDGGESVNIVGRNVGDYAAAGQAAGLKDGPRRVAA